MLWHFMQIVFMKYQSLFFGENEKNIINLTSAEYAQGEVKVNVNMAMYRIQQICKRKEKTLIRLRWYVSWTESSRSAWSKTFIMGHSSR